MGKPDKSIVLDTKEFPKLVRNDDGNLKFEKKPRKLEGKEDSGATSTATYTSTPEQASIICAFFLIKLAVSISSVHRPYTPFVYLLFLVQVTAYHAIVEQDLVSLEKEQQI